MAPRSCEASKETKTVEGGASGRRSCRRSKVEGSKVEGRRSKVEGRRSKVEGASRRVTHARRSQECLAILVPERDPSANGTRYFFLPAPFFAARLRLALDRRLFTVAAAMRFAVFALRPRPFADFLILSYIRLFLAPFTPRGGMVVSSNPGSPAKAVLVSLAPPVPSILPAPA